MAQQVPNPHSPEEVRRAFQRVKFDTAVLSEGALGEILVGAGAGTKPTWTTSLTTLTLLTVDSITINGAAITSSTGAISFDNENISTSGTISGVNVTSGNNPGHTHSIYSLVDGTRPFTGVVAGVTPVGNSDLTTKLYVDTAIAESTTAAYSAIADDDIAIGQVVYLLATGHIALAFANDSAAYKAAGLAISAGSSTETVEFYSDQQVTMADWTDVASVSALTPGALYYLNITTVDYPLYENTGGTGDRTAIITVTTSASSMGTISRLVDGTFTHAFPDFYFTDPDVTGKYLRFDFGVGVSKWISEAKWYQDTANTHGTWKWQGSNDATSWTDIGASFTLGGLEQIQTSLSGNELGYRYYQLLGISGSTSNSPYIEEIEFKIVDFTGVPYPGRITTVKPSGVGVYVVEIGRAISADTLDVEIKLPSDHGDMLGLADDDHTTYHTDGRAATWLAAGHETTYNHANYNTAYGWGNHASAGYLTAEADTLASVMGRGATTGTQLTSTLAIGTSPFAVTSTTVNTNLNADLWDGYQFADYLNQSVKTIASPTFANITDSGLTITRVPYASTAGLLVDSANLTFDGTALAISGRAPVTTIASDLSLYVATTGNDTTGDGSVGNPWATIAKAMSWLQSYTISSSATVTINVAAGTYTSTSSIALKHINGKRIDITGSTRIGVTVESVVSSSGSAGAWELVLQLTSVAGLSANQYITIYWLVGGTLSTYLLGCHKIDSVDAINNRITISTRHSAATAPSGSFSTGLGAVYTSTLVFTGCNGLVLDGAQFGTISLFAIVGDRTANTYGLYASNWSSVTIGTYTGINGFAWGMGLAIFSMITANNLFVSNCVTAAIIQSSQSILASNTSVFTCNNSSATVGYGIYASGMCYTNITSSKISGNGAHGLYVDAVSFCIASSILVDGHESRSIQSLNGSFVIASSSTVTNSYTGLYANNNSFISAVDVTFGTLSLNASPTVDTEGNNDAWIDT